MTERSLQVTYRKGRPFSAYLHLSHQTGEKSARTVPYDVEIAESYWVSAVKKKGGDRHWAGRGKITIDAGAIEEYLQITGAPELDPPRFVVSTAIEPPD